MPTTNAVARDARNATVMRAGGVALFFAKREGRAFRSSALTSEEHEIVTRAIGRKRFRMRECFYNAQRIVQDDESEQIAYVEGYRRSAPFALHAWAAINGKVIDVTVLPDGSIVGTEPTLAPTTILAIAPERHLGRFPVGEGYRGVAFSRAVWGAPSFRARDSLLDNWQAKWPAENGALDAFRMTAKGKK